jgi:hypothetical protein
MHSILEKALQSEVRNLNDEDDLIDDTKMTPIFEKMKKISEEFDVEQPTTPPKPSLFWRGDGGLEFFTNDETGELIKLEPNTNFQQFPFIILVNTVVKKIFILRTKDHVSQRTIFLAAKSASNLNSNKFKNEFTIRNVVDPLEKEMILDKVGIIQEISA